MNNNPNLTRSGILLLCAALLAALAMAHHPTGAHGENGGDFIHASMMLLLGLMSLSLIRYSQWRGLDRDLVLAGLMAWLASVALHVGAASINGFVVPALASREGVSHEVFLLAWEGNQALARLGVYASSLAFALWGLDLCRGPGRLARALGAAGLLLGLASAGALLLGILQMNLSGALWTYAGLAAWLSLLALYLIARGRNTASA